VTAFSAVGLGGVALSVGHARLHGRRHGRRWAHHVIGSAAMVIMTLAMPVPTPRRSSLCAREQVEIRPTGAAASRP
jgi:hypothetical protein